MLLVGVLAVLEKLNVTNFYHKKPATSSSTQATENSTKQKIDLSPATAADKQANDKRKDDVTTNPPSTPKDSRAQIVLNNATSGKMRTTIYGATTGNCMLHMTNKTTGADISATAQISFQEPTNSYICNTDLPPSKLTSGTYTAYATLEDGGITVKSNELTVTIN